MPPKRKHDSLNDTPHDPAILEYPAHTSRSPPLLDGGSLAVHKQERQGRQRTLKTKPSANPRGKRVSSSGKNSGHTPSVPQAPKIPSKAKAKAATTTAGRGRILEALDQEAPTPTPVSSRSPAKKARKSEDDPPEEKRGAIFKKACPRNIMDRVERVMSQRFYLVDRKRNQDGLREEFSVLGSTGNVYTVVIDKKPSCSCPDFLKGNHCKHIMFVYFKVLQVPTTSHTWYQKALLTSELAEIFARAPPAPRDIAPTRVREAFARATGKAEGSSSKSRRELEDGDDCPVCYENLRNSGELVWCESCGNATHDQCFEQWARTTSTPTCVYCRAPWSRPGEADPSEGYLNLGREAGLSPVRDTSSYNYGWHGRRRYYR